MKRLFGLLFLVCVFSPNGHAEEGPRVELFTPQGTVKGIRQVNVRFSEPMVPFGDPRGLLPPFDIDCGEKGTERWADGKNWIYDFEKHLPPGVRCEFRLKTDLRTLSGQELKGQKRFLFSTGGPSIKDSIPYEGSNDIDEEQIFILNLDGEPNEESVIQNVFFSVEGIKDHIGIRVITGKKREELLKARFGDRKLKFPAMILIQCKQRFPAESKVSLIWGRGVSSQTGVATDQDQILGFQVRKPFSVVFHCEKENPRAGCIPITPVVLRFSAPISPNLANQILLKAPDGKTWKPQWEDERRGRSVEHVSFKGPFPENTNLTILIPPGLRDDAKRELVNADKFPLTFRSGPYPPLAKFSARFGILELKGEPVLPVTLRNLEPQVKAKVKRVGEDGMLEKVRGRIFNLSPQKGEEVQAWLRRVASASREKSIFGHDKGVRDITVPKPAGGRAFEVVGIPLKKPGLYIVELESTLLGASLLGSPRPMFVPTAVLVTNLSAHLKWGRESSLVWVTALDTGEPVKDAVITVKDCQEKVLWTGNTDANGIARIKGQLPRAEELPRCRYEMDHRDFPQMKAFGSLGEGLFVTAQTPGDMTFTHSSWEDGIEPWRFQLPDEPYSGPFVAHTIFDRTLLRAGETVNMKHIFRQHTTGGFTFIPKSQLPSHVSIEHYGSGQKYEFPLTWDGNGAAETKWSIPREAKLGNYEVILLSKSRAFDKKSEPGQQSPHRQGEPRQWTSGRFRVEEFRVPLAKGVIQFPVDPLIRAEEVTLYLNVQYLAGGEASFLPVRVRGGVRPKSTPSFEGFDDFIFSNGPVEEGINRRGERLELISEEEEREERGEEKKEVKLPTVDLVLDRSGSVRTTFSNLPKSEAYKEILTELEFKDPNGEIQTVSSRIPLWPSRYLIGIKPDSWVVAKDGVKFYVAVVDLSGKAVSGRSVQVDLFERKTFSHRKRLVGGFYAYEHTVETKRIAAFCEGRTDEMGLLVCKGRSPVTGNVVLQAQTLDEARNRTVCHREVWVAGKGEWWFEVGDHDRIDLLPEKKRYQPGETAIFQVRIPFRKATALISVEREGVMEAWVKKISGKEPILEVPVRGTYAPNVFVSALVVRGRLTSIKPTAMIDLGKPAFKLGIAEIHVGWRDHELKVEVVSDRKVYKVRQKAKVHIKVRTPDGKVPPPGSEVALAAIDEGLLELMPNRSWEILPAMMGRRGYSIHTATAQMQVIGKRHFGLKALAPGGGGGRLMTRELFDTLLFWRGRLPLNENGEAGVEVPLNDSITRFRIVAVATGGTGLFGTGSTSIQSTQDMIILPGLPPLIREGDRFRAEFTVRNTTDRTLEVDVTSKVEPLTESLKPAVISLQSGEAKQVGWDLVVPLGVDMLYWEVEAKARGLPERDRIKVTQKVVPAVPVRTVQATMAQVEKDFSTPIERPEEALPGRGGVRVVLRSKISEGLNGVVDYMKRYPYTCLEQKVSVAVALRDERLWRQGMSELPSYLDSDGLVKYFPPLLYGSPTLTSYILAVAHEAGWTLPDEIREKMAAGLKKFVQGSISRHSALRTADLSIQKLSAIEALSRIGKAEAKILDSISIDPNLWPTSTLIDWLNILLNIQELPGREKHLREAEQILRSRLNFNGTTLNFSTQESDRLWWLMVSGDTNAVRLLLSSLRLEKWKPEVPRLAQGVLARQKNGAWDLTLANAWGVLAMEKFSKVFENEAVSGFSHANLLSQSQRIDWGSSPKGKTSLFHWPAKKEQLSVFHQGTGRPWVTIQSLAAIPVKKPFSSGYRIKKTLLPVEQKRPGQWSVGDTIRIRLEVEAQTDQTWVVVSDPVPAGTTILGRGLERDSQLLTRGEAREGWIWPAFEERSFEAFRAYYEYVPKGRWATEYTLRLNQSGVFQVPPTRVEALYFPEMFGEIPNEKIEVHP